jgi:hypothetical protein
MNRPVSINATTSRPLAIDRERPVPLWIPILVLVALVCGVLALDASITLEQRIALIQQSGIYP